MSDKSTQLCPQCQIGHLQSGKLTYVRAHHGMVISVPDMPTLTCDVCGYQEFESSALMLLEAMIGGQIGSKKGTARPAVRITPSDSGAIRSLKP